ncbi:MAG: aldolase/citrate lyase family protein [Dehalococcoidia bacterium]|nr:aldolase/citrate lyase family protein [Dehalococcoidia bacterium]
MQKNKTKAKLKAGEVVFGSEIMFPSPDAVEILGYAGLDFVYMDTEHSATTHESLTHMIRAAEISGATSLVRIPEQLPGQYPGYILRILDIGAMGIIVPHVDTKAEAQAVVDSMKYHPLGKRGMYGGRQTGYGFQMSTSDYVKVANEETLVVIMIESGEGVKNLPDILTVKGIDVVQIGSNDLSQSLGYPGKLTAPTVLKAIDSVIAVARKAGVPVGVGSFASFPQDRIKRFLDAGVQFVNIGTSNIITSGVERWREWLDKAKTGK